MKKRKKFDIDFDEDDFDEDDFDDEDDDDEDDDDIDAGKNSFGRRLLMMVVNSLQQCFSARKLFEPTYCFKHKLPPAFLER